MKSDRERMMDYLADKDLRWAKAFETLEKMTGVELSTPSICDLADFSKEVEQGEVSFLWDYDSTGFLVQLDIWFTKDDTPMADWFWMDREEVFGINAYDGTDEESVPLADLPEKVIDLLKEKVRGKI